MACGKAHLAVITKRVICVHSWTNEVRTRKHDGNKQIARCLTMQVASLHNRNKVCKCDFSTIPLPRHHVISRNQILRFCVFRRISFVLDFHSYVTVRSEKLDKMVPLVPLEAAESLYAQGRKRLAKHWRNHVRGVRGKQNPLPLGVRGLSLPNQPARFSNYESSRGLSVTRAWMHARGNTLVDTCSQKRR